MPKKQTFAPPPEQKTHEPLEKQKPGVIFKKKRPGVKVSRELFEMAGFPEHQQIYYLTIK
jgi:hypothetical protein